MYKLEIYDDTTLEGLLESFKNLKEAGIEGYIEIDGLTLFGTDPELEEKLTNMFHNRKVVYSTDEIFVEELDDEKEKKLKEATNRMVQGIKLSNNEVFKYYLGICLKYIKPEHRESIKRYYVESYSNDKYKKLRDIHLLANILLILEYGDVFLIQEKLNLLFLSLSRDDLKMIDDLFLRRIEKCAINGNLIKECFYRDILDDFINEFMDDVSRLMRTLENK